MPVTGQMLGAALLVAELLALAVGALWVAVEVQRQNRRAAMRLGQVVSNRLVAPTLELEAPFSERVLQPLIRSFLRRVGGLSPQTNLEKLRRELLIAGSPLGLGALDFIGLRILVAVLGSAGLGLFAWMLTRSAFRSIVAGVAGAILFAELPRLLLHRRMNSRRRAIVRALPDALDMLTVCVDAGLALESAFLRISQTWEHALGHEFGRAVTEIGFGISWRDAMRNLVYRTDVLELSGLVAVLLQADQLGFSISETLHAQADQLRIRRRQRAQEMARSAPLKMLFPMTFFILPATFVVILGPAVPAILEALGMAGG